MKKLLALLFIASLIACSGEKDQQEVGEEKEGNAKNTSFLPDATGESGEIVIIINKRKYDGALGEAIKEVFRETVPGLTRPEPMFTIRVIEPFEFNRIFRVARNLVYVTSFEGSSAADKWLQGTFSETSRERIFNNPDLFMQTSEDQYSKGQKILQLFGKDDASLIKNLKENKGLVQNFFNIAEKQRLARTIQMSTASKGILRKVNDRLGINIKIPAGYELSMLEDDFMWVRALPAVGPSKNLFVYSKPYTSQDEFKYENIIKLRNEAGKKYIYGDPENKESYMITETEYMDPVFRNINFNDQYTVEMKGAWKTNNFSVGGTFVSYTFVDEGTERLYYIEGFVIHPSEDHRELIREMESLLTTFRVS
ncbi:hypothetical protein BFP97_00225 [Roseivirga sp. 4D4]|uniref:DUF4837 family protein n=1 Tax=Roseivirga sp. 4D4 TaxID=1889784 RepID=UPI0008538AB2|nr:DUF4837 family protein [Roseivirga sp. 4D4]OEK00034.1 hypothetical protein BFP97_00225 [Roseivirga sp. 4D4]